MPYLVFAFERKGLAVLLLANVLLWALLASMGAFKITLGPPRLPLLGVHYCPPDDMLELEQDANAMWAAGIRLVVLPYIDGDSGPDERARATIADAAQYLAGRGFRVCIFTTDFIRAREEFEDFVALTAPYVDYWALLNEIDLMHRLSEEIRAELRYQAGVIRAHDEGAVILTVLSGTFFVLRPEVALKASGLVDVVGITLFEEASYWSAPVAVTAARAVGPAWLFGTGHPGTDEEQADYIIRMVERMAALGVPVVVIWHWNVGPYAIKGNTLLLARLAELYSARAGGA